MKTLAALLVLTLTACAPDAPPVPPPVADVGFEGLNLVVLNRDARAWTDCTFQIDPGGYRVTHPELRPGERASVPSNLLADATGQRFNPMTHKPVTFTLTATVGGQVVTWTTPFRYDRP